MFEPLKITARLACGIVSDDTLPIDAIIYYAAMREKYGAQDATIPGAKTGGNELRVSMPFKIVNPGTEKWFYAASFAQWSEPVAEMADHWNKRFDSKYSDMVDFGGRRGKVIVEQGRYRAYHMPVFTRHCLEACWYAVGDIGDIRRLLRFVTHIGKKIAQGWGEILEWRVEPFGHDWSVRDSGGRIMRAIPVTELMEGPHRFLFCGYRPSYWLPQNQTMCEI